MLWPRFMWGLGMLAVLVVVFAMVLPLWNKDQSKSLLAKHEPVAEELGARAAPQSAAAPATTPAQTAAPATDSVLTLNLADKDVLEARPPQPEPAKTHFFTANEPAAAPEPNTAPKNLEAPKLAGNATRIPAPEVARAESETFRQRAGEVRTQAALKEQAPPKRASPKDEYTPPTPTTAAGATSPKPVVPEDLLKRPRDDSAQLTLAPKPLISSAPSTASEAPATLESSKRSAGQRTVQRFSQVATGTKAKAEFDKKYSPGAVLVSFEVEQTEGQLRIRDNDGSIYTGYLRWSDAQLPAAAAVKAEQLDRSKVAVAPERKLETKNGFESKSQVVQNYSFSVEGTNRSLNQKVVFTGNLQTAQNMILSTGGSNKQGAGLGGAQPIPPEFAPVPLLNSRISGRAIIGDRKEININAVPAAQEK